MSDVRIGIIGLGMGRLRAADVDAAPGAKVHAVCDTDPVRLSAAASEFRCRAYANSSELIADDELDVVYVMTPTGTHLDVAAQAASAGKHVIVTKPLEVSVERAEELIRRCVEADVKLIVDFELRYQPSLQQLKVAIEAGELGEMIHAEARCKWWRSQEYYDRGGWRGTWRMDGGGSLANQGVHLVDALIWLCGMPKVVGARSGVFCHGIESEDATSALLELPRSAIGSLITMTCCHRNDTFGLNLTGTLASVVCTSRGIDVRFADRNRTHLETSRPDWPLSAVEDMVRSLREGRELFVDGRQGLASLHLIESIYAAAGIRPIGIPYVE